jgi:hypothetical protein
MFQLSPGVPGLGRYGLLRDRSATSDTDPTPIQNSIENEGEFTPPGAAIGQVHHVGTGHQLE